MNIDLNTPEGRSEAWDQINNSFLSELRRLGFEICPEAIAKVYEKNIELMIGDFGSSITIYDEEPGRCMMPREMEIKFGTSGSFGPDNKSSYWRTIHAATLLKNWELLRPVVVEHCARLRKLYADIHEL